MRPSGAVGLDFARTYRDSGKAPARGRFTRTSPENGRGVLTRPRSWDSDEVTGRTEGSGLEDPERLLSSDSGEEIVKLLPLDFSCVVMDFRIWLCRRLRGGIGGSLCWEFLECGEELRWKDSLDPMVSCKFLPEGTEEGSGARGLEKEVILGRAGVCEGTEFSEK